MPEVKKELIKEIRKARKEIRIEWKKKRSLRTSLYADQEQVFIEANPKLDPKRAAKIFQTAKLTTEMMSGLLKRSKNGALNSIDVQVPREGIKLIHQNISDPATMDEILSRRNRHHF